MPTRSGGEPSWWSSGSVPDGLPAWARRGLEESATAPTPVPEDPGRNRRRRAGTAGTTGAGRLKGWGLAAASVAAAVATVPLAVSTITHSGENTALPRVGTFPVVAPGALPDGGVPAAAPSQGHRGPGEPADASVLQPLQDPPVVVAQPPRRESVAPPAVVRDGRTTTPSTPARPTRATREDDATGSPTTRDGDVGSSPGSEPGPRGSASSGGSASTAGSASTGGSASSGGSGSSGGANLIGARSIGEGAVSGLAETADRVVETVDGFVDTTREVVDTADGADGGAARTSDSARD